MPRLLLSFPSLHSLPSLMENISRLQLMASLTLLSTATLASGAGVPRLGFGVALSKDTRATVSTALEAGYRTFFVSSKVTELFLSFINE